MVSKIYQICDAYESGLGHGIKQDGHSDGSIFADPEHGEAYEIGYAAGVARKPVAASDDRLRIDVSKVLEYEAYKDMVNAHPLNLITWVRAGQEIILTDEQKEQLENWKYVGLTNMSFFELVIQQPD